MRTRDSNRTKRYTLEKYDFDASSEEDVAPPAATPRKRRKNVPSDDDDVFDAAADDAAGESQDDEPVESSEASPSPSPSPSASITERDPQDRFHNQVLHRVQAFNLRAVDAPVSYLPVEPMPPEGFMSSKAYVGPFERSLRGDALAVAWYGPGKARVRLAQRMLDRWMGWTVLPPKITGEAYSLPDKGVWTPDWAEKEAYFANKFAERLNSTLRRSDVFSILSEADAEPYRLRVGTLPVLMGLYEAQQDISFTIGSAHAISEAGLPFDQDDEEEKYPTGWMLDVGGIALSMDWEPSKYNPVQLLAVAVIPHHDQEIYNYEEESAQPDFQKCGTVQLWEFTGGDTYDGFVRPSTRQPKLRKTLCLDYGRARRVKWSPVCGQLAILCGDGRVCVVAPGDEGDGIYEKVQNPISLHFSDDPSTKATAMTWVTFNRLAVGYSDGSIALWSLHPRRLLSRHPVHHAFVVDMASGYPSAPYIIASNPIGGNSKLIDLNEPSYETTQVQTTSTSPQPGLLDWSDHLQGFFSIYPSSSALNTVVGFMHQTQYPIFRRVYTGECFVSCLSVGRTHPFLLIGASDGSLWALNPQVELFSKRREPSERLRVFQHEHRPAYHFPEDSPAAQRGASRILQGFAKDLNRNRVQDVKPTTRGKKPKRGEKQAEQGGEEDDTGNFADPSRGVVYESTTRISTVQWNPNEGYGCWAAAAMASGLVRVIDLGLEVSED